MRAAVILSLIVAGLCFGCDSRPELAQVDGTLRAGGKVLPNVVVTFVPNPNEDEATVPSMAQTDESGRFRLRTEDQQDGAVVGAHRVVVEDLAILAAPRAADGTVLQRPPPRFSAMYSDLLKTPLVVEVKAGSQTLDLNLDVR